MRLFLLLSSILAITNVNSQSPVMSTLPSNTAVVINTASLLASTSHPVTCATASPTVPAKPSVTLKIRGKSYTYPPTDLTLDVNDPIVKGWLNELDLSKVPNLPCSNNGVVNHNQPTCNTSMDPNQGSWTCQKYTALDDVQSCPTTGNWGLTYDDGPSIRTPKLLDTLKKKKIKATFFVVGSRVVSYPLTLKAAFKRGHHIAIHTWSHPALTSLSNASVVAELKWTMKVNLHTKKTKIFLIFNLINFMRFDFFFIFIL